MVESVNKHRKEPFPAELQFAFVRMSCVHYIREETRTEREGAYRSKTDSDVKTSVLFFFVASYSYGMPVTKMIAHLFTVHLPHTSPTFHSFSGYSFSQGLQVIVCPSGSSRIAFLLKNAYQTNTIILNYSLGSHNKSSPLQVNRKPSDSRGILIHCL